MSVEDSEIIINVYEKNNNSVYRDLIMTIEILESEYINLELEYKRYKKLYEDCLIKHK